MHGFGGACGRLVKGHGAGGHERQAEELVEDFADLAIGEPQFVAQEDRGRLGGRADLAMAQLSLGRLENGAATVRAEGRVMLVGGDDGFGLQDDVFLNLFVDLASGLQAGGGAVRANAGRWDLNNVINMVRNGTVPRRVAEGSSALALFGGLGSGRAVGFETRSMLGAQAGAQFGVLLFQTLVLGLQSGQFLGDAPHVVTVTISVRVGIGDELAGPTGGETAQMGTGVLIGALKAGRGLFIAPHRFDCRPAAGVIAS